MKVYEWKETEHHFIAVIRPKELFDLTSLEKASPQEHEARLRAMHRLTNQMEGYAIAHGKEKGLDFAKKALEDSPDIYAARDAKDIEKLSAKSVDGKIALKLKKIDL
jgi:hypothetical protein